MQQELSFAVTIKFIPPKIHVPLTTNGRENKTIIVSKHDLVKNQKWHINPTSDK